MPSGIDSLVPSVQSPTALLPLRGQEVRARPPCGLLNDAVLLACSRLSDVEIHSSGLCPMASMFRPHLPVASLFLLLRLFSVGPQAEGQSPAFAPNRGHSAFFKPQSYILLPR